MFEDKDLPAAAINRIAKQAVPSHINIAKEAKAALLKASTHYILYATSIAAEIAFERKRKTVSAEDVLQALKRMEFDDFNEVLEESLKRINMSYYFFK
jgi:DNA polymerase epsilon subunit 3